MRIFVDSFEFFF